VAKAMSRTWVQVRASILFVLAGLLLGGAAWIAPRNYTPKAIVVLDDIKAAPSQPCTRVLDYWEKMDAIAFDSGFDSRTVTLFRLYGDAHRSDAPGRFHRAIWLSQDVDRQWMTGFSDRYPSCRFLELGFTHTDPQLARQVTEELVARLSETVLQHPLVPTDPNCLVSHCMWGSQLSVRNISQPERPRLADFLLRGIAGGLVASLIWILSRNIPFLQTPRHRIIR
jgi:hypothetical protein